MHFRVRDVAPDILLFANLGVGQLARGYGADECLRAVAMAGAGALFLHLNPLQEALQAEGDTDFSGPLRRIGQLCRVLLVPVVAKEVGRGISADVARALADAGVAGIDVAGAGGTSWSEVERHRADTPSRARACAAFRAWGIPTAECLVAARAALPGLPVFASGGIRDGVDAAVALALGADLAGLASAVLRPATVSVEAAALELGLVARELRIAMFCAGAGDLAALRGAASPRPDPASPR